MFIRTCNVPPNIPNVDADGRTDGRTDGRDETERKVFNVDLVMCPLGDKCIFTQSSWHDKCK